MSHRLLTLAMVPAFIAMTACAMARTIEFSGQTWRVRGHDGGPGPNHWSDAEESVWVDAQGLHLKIRPIAGVWHCAEVSAVAPASPGLYRFQIASRVDQLDPNVVASPFLYKDDAHEIDIEFSRWQKAGEPNAQFVVQPYFLRGHRERFDVQLAEPAFTCYFDWKADAVHFGAYPGFGAAPASGAPGFREWSYTGSSIVPGQDEAHLDLNLWLIKGQAPTDGKEVEFIVKSIEVPSPASR